MRNLQIRKTNDWSYSVVDKETQRVIFEIGCNEVPAVAPHFIDDNTIQLSVKS